MTMSLTLPLPLALVIAVHLAGLLSAVSALMSTRTSQGAVAWILSLLFFPWLALPLFWIFGRRRFEGYAPARLVENTEWEEPMARTLAALEPFRADLEESRGGVTATESLARIPILRGNRVDVLKDGAPAFESIFAGLERAEHYVLIQFYIVRDDELGGEFRERLADLARRGVKVRFLADKIGSAGLPDSYFERLRDAGAEVATFRSGRRRTSLFQVHFRNHRKVVVVDGREAWLGGLNIGDEYLGRDPEIGRWRDTHVHVHGPAALGAQLAFLEDWYWATGEVPPANWDPSPSDGDDGDEPVIIVPSGPADPVETASLLMQHSIHSAAKRIWISSPYFVPDRAVQAALALAAFRGVDVRILIPNRSDNRIVDLAGFAFFEELLRTGVRIFRFQDGFLHCKTAVVDDVAAAVGTVNFDNRSFRLNFEITALLLGSRSIDDVARHFEEDFASSTELTLEELDSRSFAAKAASRLAYLFAPVL